MPNAKSDAEPDVTSDPCEQCDAKPYKLDAMHEREWVTKYDNIIELVQGLKQ